MIINYCIHDNIFTEPMWVAFAFAKDTHIFFSKNTCESDFVLTRTVNMLTTNDLVKLPMFWITRPWSLWKQLCIKVTRTLRKQIPEKSTSTLQNQRSSVMMWPEKQIRKKMTRKYLRKKVAGTIRKKIRSKAKIALQKRVRTKVTWTIRKKVVGLI